MLFHQAAPFDQGGYCLFHTGSSFNEAFHVALLRVPLRGTSALLRAAIAARGMRSLSLRDCVQLSGKCI